MNFTAEIRSNQAPVAGDGSLASRFGNRLFTKINNLGECESKRPASKPSSCLR